MSTCYKVLCLKYCLGSYNVNCCLQISNGLENNVYSHYFYNDKRPGTVGLIIRDVLTRSGQSLNDIIASFVKAHHRQTHAQAYPKAYPCNHFFQWGLHNKIEVY